MVGGLVSEGSPYLINSTEYIKVGEDNEIGPDIPLPLWSHTIAAIDGMGKSFMLVGGDTVDDYFLSKTFQFEDQHWTIGPYLNEGRSAHASGLINDRVTEEYIMVVAGGFNGKALDSVEILYPEKNQWKHGIPNKVFIRSGLSFFPSF